MLLKFICENYRSIREEVVLDLAATSDNEHPAHRYDSGNPEVPELLRTAAIYGPNAAGKSNLIKALQAGVELVRNGTRGVEQLDLVPFGIGEDWKAKPTRMEFYFLAGDRVYNYGLVAYPDHVEEEWLYRVSRKKEVLCFARTTTSDGEASIDFGEGMGEIADERRQFLGFVATGTRSNQLFLAETREKNVQELALVRSWFDDNLRTISPDKTDRELPWRALEDHEYKEFLDEVLNFADIGIVSLSIHKNPVPETLYGGTMPPKEALGCLLEQHFSRNSQNMFVRNEGDEVVVAEIKTHHAVPGEHPAMLAELDLSDESDGTRRLLNLAHVLLPHGVADSQKPEIFLIDELDRSLHPMLARFFLQSFLERNPGARSQLIFTTHDTNLLDQQLLRRDEIWFVSKKQQASTLYSLAEFKPRKDLRLEKGYLHGRFGAIPFLGDPTQLGLAGHVTTTETESS